METTIASITKSANNLSISLNKPSNFRVHFPPWTNTETHFIKTTNIAKKNYNSDQIIQQHLEQINTYKKQNYIIWYCDGSKTASGNAFAVVDENNTIVKTGMLPDFTSIFTSEITAIEEAIKLKPSEVNLVICTDSLSSINALKSYKHPDPLISRIKENLVRS